MCPELVYHLTPLIRPYRNEDRSPATLAATELTRTRAQPPSRRGRHRIDFTPRILASITSIPLPLPKYFTLTARGIPSGRFINPSHSIALSSTYYLSATYLKLSHSLPGNYLQRLQFWLARSNFPRLKV